MPFWVREITVGERDITDHQEFSDRGAAERYARHLANARRQEGFSVHQDTRDQYWLLQNHCKVRAIQIGEQ